MNYQILFLTLGTFAIGMEGFMIAGLLPALSQDLNVSLSVAGQLVTVFSITYALGSPILTTMTGKAERSQVLLWSLLLFAAGNFLCGMATVYPVVFLGRVITALGAGLFAPAATHAASVLVPPDKRGRSLSMVLGGADRSAHSRGSVGNMDCLYLRLENAFLDCWSGVSISSAVHLPVSSSGVLARLGFFKREIVIA